MRLEPVTGSLQPSAEANLWSLLADFCILFPSFVAASVAVIFAALECAENLEAAECVGSVC